MSFQSESEYFAECAATCRAVAARCKNVFDALANADLADRYDKYARAARRLETGTPPEEDR